MDVEFEPEFVGGERDEVGVLSHVLATLREQSDMLSRYESDVKLLGEDHDLWLSGPSEEANQSIGEVAANTKEKAVHFPSNFTPDSLCFFCHQVKQGEK